MRQAPRRNGRPVVRRASVAFASTMAGNAAQEVETLAGDLRRLHRAAAQWAPGRWAGRAADGRSRADVLFGLVTDLAGFGGRAGWAGPPGVLPPRLGVHALADQLAVVGAELLAAPRVGEVAAEASAAVAAARRLLLTGTERPTTSGGDS
jgi:hypothetical protein